MGLRTIDWEWTLLDNTKALVGGVWGGFIMLALRPLDASRDTFDLVFLWKNGDGETLLGTGSRRDLAAKAEREPDAVFDALVERDSRRSLNPNWRRTQPRVGERRVSLEEREASDQSRLKRWREERGLPYPPPTSRRHGDGDSDE